MKASQAQIHPGVCIPVVHPNRAVATRPRATISVVIAGRNPGSHLVEMLDSLVDQVDPADEIIYYDDFSDDRSLEILKGYQDRLPQLRIFSGKERLGVSAARNRANALATSEYIAVLDSDDLFLKDTLLKYREMISKDRSLDFIFADTIVFNAHSGMRKRSHYPAFTNSHFPIATLMVRPVLPFKHSSVIYRRSMITEIGGYREDLPLKVDFEMIIRFIRSGGKMGKLDAVTSCHRTHAGQMSRNRLKGIFSYWNIIELHEPRFIPAQLYKMLRCMGEIAKMAVGR